MVNELRSLLHETSDNAPYAAFDAAAVLRAGRSRTRRRHAAVTGAVGLAAAAVVGSTVALGGLVTDGGDPAPPSSPNTEPVGHVLRLDDATSVDLTPIFRSVNDYDTPTSDRFIDGITEDGQAIVRNYAGTLDRANVMLVDLTSGAEQPLPSITGEARLVLEASEERIVYAGDVASRDRRVEARALVLDRASATWREMRWPGLPQGTVLGRDIGPDGRLYVAVNTDVDALDSVNPDGLTGGLWSVSLTDPDDVRDEELVVGAFAIDGNNLVWSERRSGISNRLTVRDLETSEDSTFDPQSGRYCIQRSLGVDAGRIVMSQDCGTLNGVSDERLQVVSMTGEPVVTFQDDSLTGYVDGGGHLLISSDRPGAGGVYSYDLDTGDFERLSTSVPTLTDYVQEPVSDGYLLWTEGSRQGTGSSQKVARTP